MESKGSRLNVFLQEKSTDTLCCPFLPACMKDSKKIAYIACSSPILPKQHAWLVHLTTNSYVYASAWTGSEGSRQKYTDLTICACSQASLFGWSHSCLTTPAPGSFWRRALSPGLRLLLILNGGLCLGNNPRPLLPALCCLCMAPAAASCLAL